MPLAAYAGIQTFARRPHTQDLDDVDVAVLGVPFDTGVTFRAGGRIGPAAVRKASAIVGPYNPAVGVSAYGELSCVDYGEAPVVPGNTLRSFASIERCVRRICERGVVPFLIGGDHSCTLPHLRGLRTDSRPVAIVHFDAHTDLEDTMFGERYCHGTWLRRAIEEELVDPAHSIQVGLRGSVRGPYVYEDVEKLGLTYLTTDAVRMDLAATARKILERVGDRPTYLTFDLDVIDPAFAPGVGCPEPGGLVSWEVMAVLRGLRSPRPWRHTWASRCSRSWPSPAGTEAPELRYGVSRLGPRNRNVASRMEPSPSKTMSIRLSPAPNPPCGGHPNRKTSR